MRTKFIGENRANSAPATFGVREIPLEKKGRALLFAFKYLEDTERRAHRSLDVQGLDVLPVLLQQRN